MSVNGSLFLVLSAFLCGESVDTVDKCSSMTDDEASILATEYIKKYGHALEEGHYIIRVARNPDHIVVIVSSLPPTPGADTAIKIDCATGNILNISYPSPPMSVKDLIP